MRYLITVLLVMTFAPAATAQTAADHYVSGITAWESNNIDKAISEWQQALRLKPESSLTKDRLIEALGRKVSALQREIDALKLEREQAVRTIRIEGAPNTQQAAPTMQTPPRQASQSPPKREVITTSILGKTLHWTPSTPDIGVNLAVPKLERSQYGSVSLVGYVTHKSKEKLRGVQLTFNLYDAQGLLIGNTWDAVYDFEPRTVWNVNIPTTYENAASFKLTRTLVRCDPEGNILH